jgi:hypothetical protein
MAIRTSVLCLLQGSPFSHFPMPGCLSLSASIELADKDGSSPPLRSSLQVRQRQSSLFGPNASGP